MDIVYDYLAAGWVDVCTLLFAIGYAKIICNRTPGQHFISRDTGLSILHGIAIFPLILLVFASFFPPALEALLHSHKLILATAGLVALFSMLEHRNE